MNSIHVIVTGRMDGITPRLECAKYAPPHRSGMEDLNDHSANHDNYTCGTSITFATGVSRAADQFGPCSLAHVFEPRGSTFG